MQVSAGTLRHGRHRCAWSWSYKYLLATQDEGMLGLNSDPLLKAVHALNCWTISEVFLSHLYKNKTKTWIWGLNSSCQADTQALYSRGHLAGPVSAMNIHYSIHFRWPHVLFIPSCQVGWSLFTQQGGKYYANTCTTFVGVIIVSKRGRQQLNCQPLVM